MDCRCSQQPIDHAAPALLEVCAHTSANDVPPEFTLLKIEGPDMEVPSIKADDLGRDWQAP
jgi:hypothetical protein